MIMTNKPQTGNPPAEASPALEFCLRLNRAYASVSRRLDVDLGTYHGLSFSDFTLLLNLGRAPGGRLRRVDLAERLGLTASGATRALLPLEKIGLVKRQADPHDARVGYAVLTSAGQKLLANAMSSAEVVCADVLQSAPAKQVESLGGLLGQLAGINASNA